MGETEQTELLVNSTRGYIELRLLFNRGSTLCDRMQNASTEVLKACRIKFEVSKTLSDALLSGVSLTLEEKAQHFGPPRRYLLF